LMFGLRSLLVKRPVQRATFHSDIKFLKGKVALVTGSTSGIGLSIAKTMASRGANVMINGFGEPDSISTMVKEIEQEFGVSVAHNSADLTHPEQTRQMVEECLTRFGSVDILCNNAGLQHTSPVEQFPAEMWDKLIALHLSAPFHAIKTALPHMRKKNWGRIINTASVHGLVASVNKSAYVSAKHGLVGLTKAVALETAGSGITCNAIGPGWVLTPLVQKQIDDRAQKFGLTNEEATADLVKEKMPSKKMATSCHVAALVLYFCTDMADNITGQCYPIDGGWTIQ